MADKLRLYGIIENQPTRAVIWLCKINKLPYALVKVNPGMCRKDFIANVISIRIIPSINDVDGCTPYVSAAIMTYLCE